MDPDSKQIQRRLNDLEIQILKERTNAMLNGSDVFQSVGVRRLIQTSNGLDRFLLDYGFNFLPYCSIIFYILFIIAS